MFSHENEVEMTRCYRKDHDLMGYEADDLLSVFDTLKEEDIWQYRYPDDSDLNVMGVRGIYLGNYVRWDPKAQHEQMISQYGYRTSRFLRTFDCYDYVDCFNYINIHDQLKLYKHGFSKVTDHACREIRHGRLTRKLGFALIRQYEQSPAEYVQLFESWLGVTSRSMNFLMDQHRNQDFWNQREFGEWEFNGLSQRQDPHYMELYESKTVSETFEVNEKLECNRDAKYITIGKGWP